jgi:hypothetical protein
MQCLFVASGTIIHGNQIPKIQANMFFKNFSTHNRFELRIGWDAITAYLSGTIHWGHSTHKLNIANHPFGGYRAMSLSHTILRGIISR